MEHKIDIKDFKISCIVGDLKAERTKKQDVFIDIELYFEMNGKIYLFTKFLAHISPKNRRIIFEELILA